MHLDMATGLLTIGNEPVKLGPVEARILAALISAAGRPITSRAICEHVWPYSGGPDAGINNVSAHIWHMTKKGKLRRWPRVIECRLGFGYALTIPASMSGGG